MSIEERDREPFIRSADVFYFILLLVVLFIFGGIAGILLK